MRFAVETGDFYPGTTPSIKVLWKVMNGKLNRAYTDLKEAQAAIILQEKLSSLGMLSASIAHGVHNPLFALSVSTRRLEELTGRLSADQPPYRA